MAIPGTRVLAFAARWFDPATVSRVFEPLVADWQREWAAAHGMLLRLRWLAAIAQTFVWCLPRAFGVRMPAPLLFDVVACAVSFPLAALIFQWREVALEQYFGWRVIGALSFTIIPVVWRFRIAAIPEHQGRALVRSYVLLISSVVLLLGYEEWLTRWAQVAGILLLAFAGRRLADLDRLQTITGRTALLVKFVGVAGCLTFASWPVKLALGVDFESMFWQRQTLLMYAMAGMTVVTMKQRFNGFTSIRP